MSKQNKINYKEIQRKVFDEKQNWWFKCQLGHGDYASILISDISFENAIEELTERVDNLNYDGYELLEWDFNNPDKKADYDYTESENLLDFDR